MKQLHPIEVRQDKPIEGKTNPKPHANGDKNQSACSLLHIFNPLTNPIKH